MVSVPLRGCCFKIGNVTDYYVDGVKSKKKEYTEVLETACGIDIERVKMLMVLGYFADTMKTDEKRRILFEMTRDFTDMDVIAANEELEGIEDFFLMPGTEDQHYTVEQWKKIATEQRKKLNKDLETIPARIDEASKNVAENVEDMEDLNAELNRLEEKKSSIEEKKRSLSTSDAPSVRRTASRRRHAPPLQGLRSTLRQSVPLTSSWERRRIGRSMRKLLR